MAPAHLHVLPQAACALGQLERLDELVGLRVRVGELFGAVITEFPFLLPLKAFPPEERTNTYWGFVMILDCEDEAMWYVWRDLWNQEGGDFFYAAWKLTYQEDFFQHEVAGYSGVTQRYEPGLCPRAEWTQRRMICLKTNYWDLGEARAQAEVLRRTAIRYREEQHTHVPG